MPPYYPPAVVNKIEEVFVKRASGGWTCRHCQMIPSKFRAPGAIYENKDDDNDNPPDQTTVEQHLSVCSGNTYYYANMMSPQNYYLTVPNYTLPTMPIQNTINHHHSIMQLPPPIEPLDTTNNLLLPEDRGKIGFAGMACKHCKDKIDCRKFFWSNVDRISNSFSEIPAHIMRCKHAPYEVNLIELKKIHPQQLAKYPRGSQKIFLRRMWKRMHGDDAVDGKLSVDSKAVAKKDHMANSLNVDTIPNNQMNALPGFDGRVTLAIAEDQDWLSEMDCFVRRSLEVFQATEKDVRDVFSQQKKTIAKGQVGIRCIYCAASAGETHCEAIAYPSSISHISKAVREFRSNHLQLCQRIPTDQKKIFDGMKTSSSLTSVLKRYYVLSAKALGLIDLPNGGIGTKEVNLRIGSGVSLDVLASIVSEQTDVGATTENNLPSSPLKNHDNEENS
eukprot:CAMPEP_0116069904 /NCGR_PEP_ID=MMETSP0322-20121206/12623_1 /TAXON_ID=163516 /ORGANISM="Leptocylindrus danicus var. apora, Strain B651" /LENGTH=445 /DNA_ID=CAMNT_0003557473 /DNA_START=246 /DNA_END=1580 /DNA_ORIENTATION=+